MHNEAEGSRKENPKMNCKLKIEGNLYRLKLPIFNIRRLKSSEKTTLMQNSSVLKAENYLPHPL